MRIKSTESKTMGNTGKLKLNIKTKVLNQQHHFDHKILPNRESGVALIIALGITFMLLMLGLAFVTTSIIERKSALNFQYMNTARALAQTAFNRGIADMKLNSLYPKESMHTIVSHDDNLKANTTDSKIYWDSLPYELTTVIQGDTYYSLTDDYPNGHGDITDTDNVTWIYMQYPEDNNQLTDSSIFGRIAYVVLPDKGKIDPWAVIDSGLNADTFGKIPPSEFQYGGGVSLINQIGNEVYGRPGKDITELCLASLEYDSDTFYPAYTKGMSVKTCSPVGKVDIGDTGKYKDIEDLFDKLSISQNNDTIREYFNEVFYINPVSNDEKYWIDTNHDAVRDIKELHDRFNIAERGKSETGADTYTWEDLTPSNIGSISGELTWIINMKNTSIRDQIIANLIDYCDSETNASTNYEFDPVYVGLERCPYFNEIVIRLEGTITRIGDTEPYSFNFKVIPSIDIELVDMYGISNTPSKIYVDKLIMSCDIGISDNYIHSASTAVTVDSNVSFDVAATPSSSYLDVNCATVNSILSNYGIDTSISQDNLGVSDITNLKMRVKISNLNLRLKAAGTDTSLYDYSKVNTDTYGEFFVTPGIEPITKTASITYDFQIADPRQNLFNEEWAQDTSVSVPILGTRNSSFPSSFTSSNVDKENADIDPWQISTAYIRNAPMQSPWELGFIHRGIAFQTINLKKYNTIADGGGFGPGAYAGEYSDGDANILDQIKMTSNLATQGKINLNTDNQSVLRTLFDHISVGTIPSWSTPGGRNLAMQNPGTGGTAISVIKANELASEVLNNNGTDGGTPFFTRAQIVNAVTNLQNGIYGTQVNDAQQEEIIGKFINLTKVETPDLYTIIAIGQAIKDFGNDAGIKINKNGMDVTIKKGVFDINGDEVVASQKIFGLIKRISDPDKTDTFYIKDIMYLGQ